MKTMKNVLKDGVKSIVDNQIKPNKELPICILFLLDEPEMPEELLRMENEQ